MCPSTVCTSLVFFFFFFNDTATTEIYTLSLHDALPIYFYSHGERPQGARHLRADSRALARDRKSTRLNSSHLVISYAVFCLKKKNKAQCYWRRTLCVTTPRRVIHTLMPLPADQPSHRPR